MASPQPRVSMIGREFSNVDIDAVKYKRRKALEKEKQKTQMNLSREFLDPTRRNYQQELLYAKEDQEALVDLLRERGFGSIIRGWRRDFDPDGLMEVDFYDYVKAASRLGFCGDPILLFGTDGNHKTLQFRELAPNEGRIISLFSSWVTETFGSHQAFYAAMDTSKTRRISRAGFHASCRLLKFDATDEELDVVFDCSDFNDFGSATVEDFIFAEMDPVAKSQELYKAKVGQIRQWKLIAGQEYVDHMKKQQTNNSKLPQKHRLAPRPWLAKTFESMPTVISQVRLDRHHDLARKARHARLEFLEHLRKCYGHEVRALRRVFDLDGTHSFTVQTLRSYCRRQNLPISVPALWHALDRDGDGTVRLEELNVHTALVLADFQKWARSDPCLGRCAAIWESPELMAVSRRRTGTWFAGKRMLAGTVLETLKELGWPGSHSRETWTQLFQAIDFHGCGMICQGDFEWLDKWRPYEWVYADPDPAAWSELKQCLINKYQHPLRAWRTLLDQDDSNYLSYTEFKDACRKIKFRGNVPGAWRAVDTDLSGSISMKEYDPESAELLCSFKEWVETNYGSVKHCFKALSMDRTGSVAFAELKRACNKLYWGGDVKLLFDCLDVDREKTGCTLDGCRTLSLAEVGFLDSWRSEMTEADMEAEDEAEKADLRQSLQPPPRRNIGTADRLSGPQHPKRRTVSCLDTTLDTRPSTGDCTRRSLSSPAMTRPCSQGSPQSVVGTLLCSRQPGRTASASELSQTLSPLRLPSTSAPKGRGVRLGPKTLDERIDSLFDWEATEQRLGCDGVESRSPMTAIKAS
eukprot:TRINITY_DN43368_c0_g1_i1.p1 TRINITY_DN43368_c0_g1~~TRINITY_DN43368_c0_g1_i1.p1  ORF type:complete len:807 (-),score=89.01 TRINITY_DN43368_c0_g1_i1:237-2657(-)